MGVVAHARTDSRLCLCLCCSIRLTTFDTVKRLIAAGEKELQSIIEENRKSLDQSASDN